MKRHLGSLAVLSSIIVLAGSGVLHSQSQTPTLAAPTIFRMAGTLQTATGEPRTGVVVLVASLYNAQDDVTALWSEAQTVTLDQTGRYSILVGSSVDGGVPKEFFLNGTGRWLGVGVQGEAEQPRIMLVSVPFAVKALDADTLAGKTAAEFVLADTLGSSVKSAIKGDPTIAGNSPATNLVSTTNALAKFTDTAGTLGNSTVSEMGGDVSISGRLNASGFGSHIFSASGTGANRIQLTNPAAGSENNVLFRGDTDIAEIFSLRGTSSNYTASMSTPRAGAELYTAGSGGLSLTAANAAGAIRFYSGGMAERMSLSSTGLLNLGGSLSVGGGLNVAGFGQHTFSAGGTGANRIQLTNPTAGATNNVLFRGDTDLAEIFSLRGTSSTYTASGSTPRSGAELYTSGSGGLSLTAGDPSGAIRFYTGGTTQRMSLSPDGLLTVAGSLNVTGFGSHTFSAGGTGANRIQLSNPTAGAENNVLFRGDTDIAEIFSLRGTSSTYAGSGATPQAGAELYTAGSGGMSITAANSSGAVRFYSGGTSERMRIETTGNVGIGTATPLAKLDVNGNINVSGNINAKYQDVAEWVETSTPLEPGTVVIVDPKAPNRVLASSKAYDTRVAGAVSKQPGLILGEGSDTKAMVAQSGRVRIKVDASYGAIRVGDLLVTSPTPGYAMRSRPMMVGGVAVHRAGTLVGKALEALPRGKGEILVLLTLQ